jgi:hypothetical protein
LAGSTIFFLDNGLRSFLPWDRTSVFRNTRDALYFVDDYRQDEFGTFVRTAEVITEAAAKLWGLTPRCKPMFMQLWR